MKLNKVELAYLLNIVRYEEHELIDLYNSKECSICKSYLDDEIKFTNTLYKKLMSYYKNAK